MNFKFISLTLILLAPAPIYLSLFQFLNNGGMNWPMQWSNEVVFWGVVFSIFSVAGILIAFNKRAAHPYFAIFTIFMAAIVLAPTVFNLINIGFDPSSKADSKTLEPLQFWVSDWWK